MSGLRELAPIIAALQRCDECWDDGMGSDIGRPMLDALATFGLLHKDGRDMWSMTDAGSTLLATQPEAAPNVDGAMMDRALIPFQRAGYSINGELVRIVNEALTAALTAPGGGS